MNKKRTIQASTAPVVIKAVKQEIAQRKKDMTFAFNAEIIPVKRF